MAFRLNPKGPRCVIDVFSVGLILVAVIFAFAVVTFIQFDMYLAVVGISYISMIGFSLAMAKVLGLLTVDFTLTFEEIGKIILLSVIGFCATVGMQGIILEAAAKISITDVMNRKMFYGATSVMEELFFNMLLFTLLDRGTNAILAAFFVSTIFPPYHAVVYGIESPAGLSKSAIMLAIGVSRFILCLIMYASRDKKGNYRIVVPTLVHFAINMVAG